MRISRVRGIFVLLHRALFTYTRYILILACALAACNKKSKPAQYIIIPQAIKNYVAFKPGTYWIYADSASGQVDSEYVLSLNIDTHANTTTGGTYQVLTMYVKTAFDTLPVTYTLNSSLPSFKNNRTDTGHLFMLRLAPHAKDYTCYLHYPLADTTTLSLQYIINAYVHFDTLRQYMYSGYKYNSLFYNDVVQVTHTADVGEGFGGVHYYIIPHIGLVRKAYPNGRVWNLIRYYIVQ